MQAPVDLQLTHVGLFVRDIEVMARFYCDVLGMVETDRGTVRQKHHLRFLTRNPQEHHQLVLATGRPADVDFSVVNQLSFRVADLEGMRATYRMLTDAAIAIERAVTHGNGWSMYFKDPEGNLIEVYTHSEWYVPQPFAYPADFSLPAEELMAQTERYLAQSEGVQPRAAWSAALAERIANHRGGLPAVA